VNSQIHAREIRETSRGKTRQFRCTFVDEENGEKYYHPSRRVFGQSPSSSTVVVVT